MLPTSLACRSLLLLAFMFIVTVQPYKVVLDAMLSDGSRQIVQQSQIDQSVIIQVIWNGEELIWTQFEDKMLHCIVRPLKESQTVESGNALRFDAFPWIPKYRDHRFSRASELFAFCSSKAFMVLDNPSLFMMPDTKWCGLGTNARDNNDFGPSVEADQCCFLHKKCKETIPGMQTYKGFTNPLPYTLHNCKCDDEFYMCLKRANDIRATEVGYIYFNILQLKCFLMEKKKKRRDCMSWMWGFYCPENEDKEFVMVYDPQVF